MKNNHYSQPTPHTNETLGELDELANHRLLHAFGCSANCSGAQAAALFFWQILDANAEIFQSYRVKDWISEVQQLSERIAALQNPTLGAPSSEARKLNPWGTLLKCRPSQFSKKLTPRIDAALGGVLLHYASKRAVIHKYMADGFSALYRGIEGHQNVHSSWRRLAEYLPLTEQEIKSQIESSNHDPSKVFLIGLLAVMSGPTPDLLTSTGLKSKIFDSETLPGSSQSPNSAPPVDDAAATSIGLVRTVDAADSGKHEMKRFKRGDSFIAWQWHRAIFGSVSNKLGLDGTWETLPLRLIQAVMRKLVRILRHHDDPERRPYAVLAIISLLSNLTGRMALNLPLVKTDDLYLDLANNFLCWAKKRCGDSKSNDGPAQFIAQSEMALDEVRIPIPALLSDALLRQTAAQPTARYVDELLGVPVDEEGRKKWLMGYRSFLMSLGDPAYPPYPGRWGHSLSRVYLNATNSDLIAALCGLDFQLVGPSALDYFHPSPSEISSAATATYQLLGLHAATPVDITPSSANLPLIADASLKVMFANIENETELVYRQTLTTKDLSQKIARFNRLAALVAAWVVLLTAGRGTRIERLTFGGLWSHPLIVHVFDKIVMEGHDSRLLPKLPLLSIQLHRYLTALIRVSKAIVETTGQKDPWSLLRKGNVTFNGVAFFVIELHGEGKTILAGRKPLKSDSVAAVINDFFGRERNFMRHQWVTQWALRGEDPRLARLLTGHGRQDAEMPGPCATYSPLTAIQECLCAMEKLGATWLPNAKVPKELTIPEFASMPTERMRQSLNSWRQAAIAGQHGPRLGNWHLAGTAIVKRLRTKLVAGKGPTLAVANFLLHLLLFDGIHNLDDLEAFFDQDSDALMLGPSGWTYTVTRRETGQVLANVLQAPTALFIKSLRQPLELKHQWTPACKAAHQWLMKELKATWSTSHERYRDSIEGLAACVALWSDLHLPPALEFCYHPQNLVSTYSLASSIHLLQSRPQTVLKSAPEANWSRRLATTSTSDALDSHLKVNGTYFSCPPMKSRA